MSVRSVAIMLHPRQRHAPSANYRIWALAENWKRQGIRVDLIWGPATQIDADVLIPHIDVSYLPDRFWRAIQQHPNVVNRHVRDIRKTAYSRNIITRDSDWPGPVIVKTVNNCGGGWDEALGRAPRRQTRFTRWKRRIRESPLIERYRLGSAASLRRYYIFDALSRVPRRVFANPNLIVERFLPERHGSDYAMRMLIVFGDRWIGRMLIAPDPFVKSRNSRLIEEAAPPAEIVARRAELGIDYGKIDYVINNGEPVLLDINVTPTVSGPVTEDKIVKSADLALGIAAFAQRQRPASPHPARLSADS